MSYIVPSTLVYQQLENAGGVANSTPDLEACIVGPAYNVLRYVAGDTASLIKTAATSATTATASIPAGSKSLTFATLPPFTAGDTVLVAGASDTGGILSAKVVSALGVVLTLDTAAGTAVTNAVVTKQGVLTNAAVNNTFTLPGRAVGQVVDNTSIQVYANQAKIETLLTNFTGYSSGNTLVMAVATGTGNINASSNSLSSVTNPANFAVGDPITVAGAGAAGAVLTTKITAIVGSTFTLKDNAATTVSGAAVAKQAISNINSTTSTLMVEAGDEVAIDYIDTGSVARTVSSTVLSVNSVTGTISNITIADVLPANASAQTTATAAISANATGFTLTSSTGFATGDTIIIRGAGAGGADHEAVIGTLTGSAITGLSPATVTAVGSGAVVIKRTRVTLKTRKLFNNQLIPATKPISGGANYTTANVAVDGSVTINVGPEIIYGKLISGNIHFAYKALRTDLSGSIMAIADPSDNLGVFGDVSEDNPLALGCQITLANTTTRVRAIAIPTNDPAGYQRALELAEAERVYALVPLTQDVSVCQAFATHAQQLSTPENALWRIALVNTAIPTTAPVGPFTSTLVNANSGNNTITLNAGNYILTASNATFISDGVVAGDTVNITASSGTTGAVQVLNVLSNQQVVVQASAAATGVSYYVTRTLSKTQRAAAVAATSKTFGSNRVTHIQPDTVVVNIAGRSVALPGYYLACGIAGLVAGFPSQQGFTNVGIAGISDLSNSNFVFTRAQLNTMAEAGTCLVVQETAGGIPYIRHELTTDMSVYEYRELQAVKNWDFLSYFYYDKLQPFIGKWNITPDTLGVIRQTIVAASELLKGKKLPRIGAPLIDYNIRKLEQDANNKDNTNVELQVQMPYINNYTNLYLII